jgi:hypothetical protein
MSLTSISLQVLLGFSPNVCALDLKILNGNVSILYVTDDYNNKVNRVKHTRVYMVINQDKNLLHLKIT